jgi:hypothetical protein
MLRIVTKERHYYSGSRAVENINSWIPKPATNVKHRYRHIIGIVLSECPQLSVFGGPRHTVSVIVHQKPLRTSCLTKIDTNSSQIIRCGIVTRFKLRFRLQFLVLLLQCVTNNFYTFLLRHAGRVEPALFSRARVGLHNIRWVRPEIETEHEGYC